MKEYRGVVLALGVVLSFSTMALAEEFQLKDPLFKDSGEQYVDSTGPRKINLRVFAGLGNSTYNLQRNASDDTATSIRMNRSGGYFGGFEAGYEFGDTPKFLRLGYRYFTVKHENVRSPIEGIGMRPAGVRVQRTQVWSNYAWMLSEKVELALGLEFYDRGVNRQTPLVITKMLQIGPRVELTYNHKIKTVSMQEFIRIMAPVYLNEGIARTGFNPFAYNIDVGVKGYYKISERTDIGVGFELRREYLRFEGIGERASAANTAGNAKNAVLAGLEKNYQMLLPFELRTRF